MLSGKGSDLPQTDRRLAQKQPSFKESVIAHCSIWVSRAKNVTRLKHTTEVGDLYKIYFMQMVGERSKGGEGQPKGWLERLEVRMQA